MHNYQRQELKDLTDFVVLDSLLHGIVLKGGDFVYDILENLQSFPKEYLLYRLNKAKQFYRRAEELEGEAQNYYTSLANVAVGEVESVLYQGTTMSKREMKDHSREDIPPLEKELAREGDKVWLN